LSLKYGLLPVRVKVIIWCRHHFWEEIYPRVGETGMRLANEAEYFYAQEHPFVDYGKDLELMSEMEKGIRITRFKRSEKDRKPDKEQDLKIRKELARESPNSRVDVIVEKFVGKGGKGYYIKEYKPRTGKGAARVSEMFRKVVKFGEKEPHFLPKKVKKKLHLGPRLASKGYRM
jgi:hypothetical protein